MTPAQQQAIGTRPYRDQCRHSVGGEHQGTRYDMEWVYPEAFASGST